MYPWQSGSDGREESQRAHLNPRSGHWIPDTSDRQRHIGLGVAYSIWQYYQATGDLEFRSAHGAEVMLEVARFFADLAQYDPATDRYRIRGVMGPGYRDLPDLDWEDYRRRYGNLQRLDRILEAEGRSVDDYQVSKQADVLMLFYLLSADELRSLLEGLGYALPAEAIPKTIEYYLARTAQARRCRRWCTPGCSLAPTATTPSSTSSARCAATSPTSRVGPPPKACTSVRWRAASICCSGASPGWRPATTPSGSTPTGPAGVGGSSSR